MENLTLPAFQENLKKGIILSQEYLIDVKNIEYIEIITKERCIKINCQIGIYIYFHKNNNASIFLKDSSAITFINKYNKFIMS
jgi:hypothetical protein